MKFFEFNDKKKITFYSNYAYTNKVFPEGREQASLAYDGDDCMLFGGLVPNKSNMLWNFDPANLSWRKESDKCSNTVLLRYGHTGILYRQKLYIFGGRTKLNSLFYIPDLEVYNLDDKSWTFPNLETKKTLKLRHNHISVLIGKKKS